MSEPLGRAVESLPAQLIQNRGAPDGSEYQWIVCRGCKGEVGIPAGWAQDTVECPECGLAIQVHGRVLYRPPLAATSASLPPAATKIPATPSLELVKKSESTFVCGIVCVVLGWTLLVPVIALLLHAEAKDMAKKESVLVPGKATAGLVLAILFGVVQGLALIGTLNGKGS